MSNEQEMYESVSQAIDLMNHLEEALVKELPAVVALVKELDEKFLDKHKERSLRSFLLMAAFGVVAGRDADDKDDIQLANFTFLIAAQRAFAARVQVETLN